jgi:hypothetical protein
MKGREFGSVRPSRRFGCPHDVDNDVDGDRSPGRRRR